MGIDIWNVLGVTPEADMPAIRKAYAARVKLCRPDEDPESFQKLRDAYESALAIAKLKTRAVSSSSLLSVIESGDSTNEEYPKANAFSDLKRTDVVNGDMHPTENSSEVFFTSSAKSVSDIFGKMEELYLDFFKRIEIKNWEDILRNSP